MLTNDFHNQMINIIRSLGLHQSDQTPCGQPISISEAHTIMELEKGISLSQSELTQILQLEKSSVSRLVQQLEKKDWLMRVPSDKDQRVKILKLSKKGIEIAKRLDITRKEKFNSILSNIPNEKHQQIIESMDLLLRAINEEKKRER